MTEEESKEWFENNLSIVPVQGVDPDIYIEEMYQAFKARILHEIRMQEEDEA